MLGWRKRCRVTLAWVSAVWVTLVLGTDQLALAQRVPHAPKDEASRWQDALTIQGEGCLTFSSLTEHRKRSTVSPPPEGTAIVITQENRRSVRLDLQYLDEYLGE